MPPVSPKQRLTIVTIGYWLLLAYIVAALVWWFISLEQQNKLMTTLRLQQIEQSSPNSIQQKAAIQDLNRRKTAQYIGEGSIFLLLILIGAVYIFRATRQQIRLGQLQQNFMMAVTHEFKTPIAITTLNLETLQKRKLDENQQSRLVSNSLQETARLNDLCNNILLTAQLEAGNSRIPKEQIDLGDLAESNVQQFQHRFPNRTFHYQGNKGIIIQGEAMSLQMLVNNLLENAVKYSPKDAPINVEVCESGNRKRLKVKDEGPGISDEEKDKVFDKFYRIGDERIRTSKGTGLGLYLCKKIMQNHKGELRLTDNEPKGSIFTASFKI
jgi:K+-sensing histidine kinase KdpD